MPKYEISLFFPVYNDEATVRRVTEKAIAFLSEVASNYEILIIDDGSPDRSGAVADELAQEYRYVHAIHHPRNLGYGAAVKTGLSRSQYEWICFTDGDDEYDIHDFHKLLRLAEHYDLIITFRYAKLYTNFRIFVSWVYNHLFRIFFQMRFRDISTGLRMIKRSLLPELDLVSDGPFIGAEITVKVMLKGYRVGEVGIQTFPRRFGRSTSTTAHNIMLTVKEMLMVHRAVFSRYYDLPATRVRD